MRTARSSRRLQLSHIRVRTLSVLREFQMRVFGLQINTCIRIRFVFNFFSFCFLGPHESANSFHSTSTLRAWFGTALLVVCKVLIQGARRAWLLLGRSDIYIYIEWGIHIHFRIGGCGLGKTLVKNLPKIECTRYDFSTLIIVVEKITPEKRFAPQCELNPLFFKET